MHPPPDRLLRLASDRTSFPCPPSIKRNTLPPVLHRPTDTFAASSTQRRNRRCSPMPLPPCFPALCPPCSCLRQPMHTSAQQPPLHPHTKASLTHSSRVLPRVAQGLQSCLTANQERASPGSLHKGKTKLKAPTCNNSHSGSSTSKQGRDGRA